jgi:hypothetical protein
MKWSDRTAQGFNPGFDCKKRALKVAPDVWARPADRRPNNPNPRLGRHFPPPPLYPRKLRRTGGAHLATSYPGVNPWAILLDHFMVKNQLPCFLNTANLLIRELANQLGSLVSSLNAAAMILSSVHSPRPNWVTNFPADMTAIRSQSIRSSFRSEEITTMAFPRSASSLRR